MEDIFKVLFGGLQNNLFPPRPLAINVDGDATEAPMKIFSSAHIHNIDREGARGRPMLQQRCRILL